MRQTTNFETACKVLDIQEDLPNVDGLPEKYRKRIIDFYKMSVIADAINKENDNWEPDYSDNNQYKYRPFFWFRPGSGFSSYANDFWLANSSVGSRLVFENEDDAQYAGKLFGKEGFEI